MKTEDRRSRLLALVEHMQGADDDIIGRLNAHEERLDDLCRQIETMRQPVAPPIDVDTLRAICAWVGHVKHEGTMVAESWDQWALTAPSGRVVTVTADLGRVAVALGMCDPMVLTLAEAHDGDTAADAGQWLRGGEKPEHPTVEAAALEFVKELQKRAAPVDVVSGHGRWDLSRSGRRVTVLGPTSEQGKFYVHANLGGGGVYLSAEGDHDARVIQLDALSAYLRGA